MEGRVTLGQRVAALEAATQKARNNNDQRDAATRQTVVGFENRFADHRREVRDDIKAMETRFDKRMDEFRAALSASMDEFKESVLGQFTRLGKSFNWWTATNILFVLGLAATCLTLALNLAAKATP